MVFRCLGVEGYLLRVHTSEVEGRDGEDLVHQKRIFEGDLYDGGLEEIDVTLYVYEACSACMSPEVEKFHV